MATTEQVPAESNEVRTFTAENTVSQQGLKSPYRSSPSLDKASPAPSGPIIARFCKDVSFVVRSANRQSATALNDIHALPHSLTSLSLSLSLLLPLSCRGIGSRRFSSPFGLLFAPSQEPRRRDG